MALAVVAEIGSVVDLPLSLLVRRNYRSEPGPEVQALADAMARDGQTTPVRVYEMAGRYVLLAGHHRLSAAELLGWSTIRASIEAAPAGPGGHLLASLADNLSHRASPVHEDARALGELVSQGLSVEEIAAHCAKSVRWVSDRLELLELHETIRPVVAGRGFVWARPLYGLEHASQRELVRQLSDETTRAQWSALCQRAREAEAERNQGGFFALDALTVETWSRELGQYVTDDESPAPVVVREQVLGVSDIARHLGVARSTAHKWQQRNLLPAPDMTVNGQPAWWAGSIDQWAGSTGRK